MENTYLGIPEFIWNNIFTVITTLLCGLIIAYFTSTFLKKKEERTRISGLILEKRLECEKEILHFLEQELTKEQLICNDKNFQEKLILLKKQYPYINNFQYSKVFQNKDNFNEFFTKYEDMLSKNKLWLDSKVRRHLMIIETYFSFISTIPIIIKQIKLPDDKQLTEKEYNTACDKSFLLYGLLLDNEINGLITELDTLIVESIYKLDLQSPKKSLSRNGMLNRDIKSILTAVANNTILGQQELLFLGYILEIVLKVKKLDINNYSEDELYKMLENISNN
jgi:hypothetical protein